MSSHKDDDKLSKNYKLIFTKTEDMKNITLSAIPVHDNTYIKIKMV